MTTRRSGFTLAEMVISLVIAAIIGASFTKLSVWQTRYYDHDANLRAARSVARSATNVMLSDLRMVQDSGGIDSAAADGKLDPRPRAVPVRPRVRARTAASRR